MHAHGVLISSFHGSCFVKLNAGADVPRAAFMRFLKNQVTPDHTLDHIKNVRIAGFSGTA